MVASASPISPASPFDLDDLEAYAAWRERKLADAALAADELWVEVRDLADPTDAELQALRERCRRFNMALYRAPADSSREDVTALGEQLGLRHLDDNLCADEDRITSLQVKDSGLHRGYIPYSNRPLQWHTDGYYNRPDQQVRSLLLHCARPASEGGENALLDVELMYIALRDRDPALIVALQHPRVMTIPANTDGDTVIRAEQSGPVFSLDPHSGDLHMRYTARKRSIEWRDDDDTGRAVAAIEELLVSDSSLVSPQVRRVRLNAGEGLLSNNALHNRTGFNDQNTDGGTRLLYRARYYQRVSQPQASGSQE